MREATAAVSTIQKQALKDLAECKVQITEDFKKDKKRQTEILTQLGYLANHKEAQKGDQEALITLLFQFKKNLTPALQTEIVTKGTALTLLNSITAYADNLKNADITQENFKRTRKTITAAALTEFNEIYDTIISISKIAGKFFKDQPHMKDQFTFTKVASVLNANSKQTPTPPKPNP